jgi:5S rRNA maturation endonuclease (ribonuclease M5)
MADITKYFKNVKKSGSGYTALCPAHSDEKNSLSIGTGVDGKILLHCHAGCSIENIVSAAGLKMSDLCPNNKQEKKERMVEAVYPYKDEKGQLLYEVIRYNPKGFSQRRPDGKGGYVYNLKGVKSILYRLPEVIEAIKNNKPIHIVEGEKDVNNLFSLGLAATCNSGGAGKWRDSFSDSLKGANVVIIPDCDEPGRKHAEQVAKSLSGKAAAVKIIKLPDMKDKQDVTDFFKKHGKATGMKLLQKLIDETKDLNKPNVNSLSTISAKCLSEKQLPPVIFTIDRLMSSGLSILAAPPKAGKSWLALWLCLQIAKGLPVWNRKTRKGSVLYLALEDSLNRLQSRLNALTDETPDNLHFATESEAIAAGLTEQLEEFISKHSDTVLIVVDTLQKVRLIRKSENAYQNDYSDAGELKRLADKHGISILVIHHVRKMVDSDPYNTISGSTGLTGAADNMYVIQKQSRTAQEAVFHATGRDIDPLEMAIRFNEGKIWELISEDASSYQEQKRFEDNPLFVLCERLLTDMGDFRGTASELHPLLATRIKATEDFRFPLNGQALSRELFTLQSRLRERGIVFKKDSDTSKRYLTLKKIPLVPLDCACSTENTGVADTSAIPAQLNIALESSNTNGSSATSAIPADLYNNSTPLKNSSIKASSATSGTSANCFYIDELLDKALKE